MITGSELAGNPAKMFDKTYGALSGLTVGDSLGDAIRKPESHANYGTATDFNKGASWNTDDTEFALLTTKTLIGCGGNLTSDIVVRAWLGGVTVQDEFRRGDVGEIEAVNSLCRGIRPLLSGKCNALHMSDGSAVRIGPVGIVCAGDPKRAAAMVEIGVSVSHYRDDIRGVQVVVVAVSVAMMDATMEGIFDMITRVIPGGSWSHYAMNHTFEIVDSVNGFILDAWMPLHDELYASNWTATAGTLPSTFVCLCMHSETPREGVVLTTNFTHDTDTIGVVTGAALSTKYGVSPIPAHWVEKAQYPTGTRLQFINGLNTKEMAGELAKLINQAKPLIPNITKGRL